MKTFESINARFGKISVGDNVENVWNMEEYNGKAVEIFQTPRNYTPIIKLDNGETVASIFLKVISPDQ